jgi:transposase
MSAKIRVPQRHQVEMRCESLDHLLPPEHPARAVWEFAGGLDLSPWTSRIRSTRGSAGAPAVAPQVLVSLWLLATLDGIASARALSGLCVEHIAYRWLCGDEPVNYHTLADFRTSDPAWLEGLLTQSAAALLCEGLADLTRVAQDGVRVRAGAGSSSFRREPTLRECLAEAEAQMEALKDQSDRGGSSSQPEAARERAAKDRHTRLQAALENLEELRVLNEERRSDKRKDPAELRVSMTDPEARKMKMADGGFRPAYNVQFATTTQGGVVVGVAVTQEGCDNNQLVPMIERIEARYGEKPAEMLVDGGYVDRGQIDEAETAHRVKVYAPVKDEADSQRQGKDPFARRPHDSDGTAGWRSRMGTADGRAVYRWRCRTAEWVNARARNRGLRQFLVRGLKKVLSSSLLYALAHNLTQAWTLRRPILVPA